MSRLAAWNLLRALAGSKRPRTPKPKKRVRFAPALETLEDRATPSVVPHSIARDDWTDTDGSNPVTVAVLANDSPSQTTLGRRTIVMLPSSILIRQKPAHGTITVDRRHGTVTYKAKAGFTGTDTFKYTAIDSRGAMSNVATVEIQVNRPTAADDWVDTDGNNPVTINVLENDSDPDGNEHIQFPGSVSLFSGPLHGKVTLDSSTNEFTYTATGNFTATASFKSVVTDQRG